MLFKVKVATKNFKKYKGVIVDALYDELLNLSLDLRGLKVVIVNSTPQGGGVAEILKSFVPLMRDLGIDASWHIIPGDKKFFDLTKNMHNALQGKDFTLSYESRYLYHAQMARSAKLMLGMKADAWVIHDPQPAGIIEFLPNFHPAVSHIHIDTSKPNQEVWEFLRAFLLNYDRVIFSTKDFVGKGLFKEKVRIIPPAIDPLTEKNTPLKIETAKRILEDFDIDPTKPLMTQVSRFDPWKDPMGVIQAYYLAKKEIPNLQLAMVGLLLAKDDPEAVKIYKQVKKHAKGDPDIFLFSDPALLGSMKVDTFVNAFQVASDVILQKSIREGFGMTVAEAMWKGKPVIGGNVGGIKIQIKNGESGFLVSSPEEAARRVVELITKPGLAKKIGEKARESVREKFLMPRLLRDYLALFKEII